MEGWLDYLSPVKPTWKKRYSKIDSENGLLLLYTSLPSKSKKPSVSLSLKGVMVDLPPNCIGNQFAICKLGETVYDATIDIKSHKINSPGYSKSSFSFAKLSKLSKSKTSKDIKRTKTIIHRFSVDDETLLIQWINSIARVTALQMEDIVDNNKNQIETKNEEPEEEPFEEINNEDDDIDMRKALKAQRAKEKRERKAATLIQSFWKMKLQRRIYLILLEKHRAASKIYAFYLMKKVRENIYKPMKKQHMYRLNVQKELLSTEKTYIDGINSLSEVFLNPLKNGKKIISVPQISSIFSNIESIANLHNYLLTELQKLLPVEFIPPYATIGNLFIFLLPQFKLYVEYINNYDSGIRLLARLRESNGKFSNFLQKQHELPSLNMKTIESFLIMPVQRLPRIEMLLKDLLKHTNEDHPDYYDLQRAFEGISELTAYVNEKKREAENFNKMAAVQRKMGRKGTGHNIVQPHRKWLKEGNLQVIRDKKKKIDRSVILFSDMLLCSTEKSVVAIKKGLHHTVRYDTLESYQLDPNSIANILEIDTEFIVKTRHASCIFYAESAKEAKEWCDTINSAIQALGKPRIAGGSLIKTQ